MAMQARISMIEGDSGKIDDAVKLTAGELGPGDSSWVSSAEVKRLGFVRRREVVRNG